MSFRTEGLCIGRTNFGNTSQVVTVLTPDDGVLGLLAKGVWRSRNPSFGGPFELGTLYELLCIPRSRGGLGLVTEAQEIEAFAPIRASRERLADAFAAISFLRQFTVPESADRRLFRLAVATLADLAAGDAGALFRFLARGLEAAGVQPGLVACSSCGREEADPPAGGDFPFSFTEGGVLCGSHGARRETTLSASVVRACRSGEAPPADRDAAVAFLLEWANFVLAYRSRMLEYPFYLRAPRRFPAKRFGPRPRARGSGR